MSDYAQLLWIVDHLQKNHPPNKIFEMLSSRMGNPNLEIIPFEILEQIIQIAPNCKILLKRKYCIDNYTTDQLEYLELL